MAANEKFHEYWILNHQTQEVYSLGPMYGGTIEYVSQKLEKENLSYKWTLLAPVFKQYNE